MLFAARMTETHTLILTWAMLAAGAWSGASAVWTLIFAEAGIPRITEELRSLELEQRRRDEASPPMFAHFPRPETVAPAACSADARPPNFRLVATLIDDSGRRSRAVVEVAGEVRVMELGERSDNFELRELERRAATVADSCSRHTLGFDETTPGLAAPPRTSSPAGPVTVNVKETLANLEQIGRQARIVPYFRSGEMMFRLLAIRPGSLFDRAGLKNGDVVESVDGRPLGELANMGAVDELVQKGAATLQLERNGEKLRIPVRFE